MSGQQKRYSLRHARGEAYYRKSGVSGISISIKLSTDHLFCETLGWAQKVPY